MDIQSLPPCLKKTPGSGAEPQGLSEGSLRVVRSLLPV